MLSLNTCNTAEMLGENYYNVDMMNNWRTAPTHMITGVQELYQHLLPTNLYTGKKIKATNQQDSTCRMCGKGQESVAHVLVGCSAITQNT